MNAVRPLELVVDEEASLPSGSMITFAAGKSGGATDSGSLVSGLNDCGASVSVDFCTASWTPDA